MSLMAEESRGKSIRPKRSELPRPKGIQALAAAYGHPMRVRIIAATSAPKRRVSPVRLAEELGEDVSIVAYHFRELVALGLMKVVEENRVRGAVEHVHEPTDVALAWQEEWEHIPPVFKQHIAALTLRLGFEAVGAAIDDGSFESRDDAVLAQDTMRVDERGAQEAMAIVGRAVEALMAVGARADARLTENNDDGFLVSYLVAGYEGALRPL